MRTSSQDILYYDRSIYDQSIFDILQAIYKGLFTLFPNLITKESYNWWVTRRLWGFRHKISKAKYLKVSVANIRKLQENTAALCRKISQNVGQTYREASGEHRGTVQNDCETLQVSAIR